MRATVTPSPVRSGKRRLLSSCAIAAGIAALAYGGPALAQVQGNAQSVPAGVSVGTNVGTKTTTVSVGSNQQTIINWIPTDTAPTGGAIDFLPSDSIWNFNGTGSYIVLNRFVNGAGGSLSRQIALNGQINSTNTATSGGQGGNIWFYNAGGILIGSTGVINVGSLVLTANDIDTTGGLLDPATGAIRFRGASGSTAGVTVDGTISANQVLGQAGSSYVALVAPRVTQAGSVNVNGSAAYVAAEQADITIRASGLFDINVSVGAEGGNVLTHSGTTRGPEQQATGLAQRIYMVAIPKNVAVGMLVSGDIGYTDSTTAVTASDGSVILSAGYNVTDGQLNGAPVNATAANLTINDTIFRSNVLAHASGAFVGQPLLTVPVPGPPVSAPPPTQTGRILIQGSGTFIGDTSATLNINAGRQMAASGLLTVRSDGVGSSPGSAAVNVNGGTLVPLGGLLVRANGHLDGATGNALGGNASLSITGGGILQTTGDITVSATATGGVPVTGPGGTGTGGTASLTVSGVGSQLGASAVNVEANGLGGGVTTDTSGVTTTRDRGGNGVGGTATLTVENAANLTVTGGVFVNAIGAGEIGNIVSGNGTGGTARVSISGARNTVSTAFLSIGASGFGGGVNQRFGTLTSVNGGDGTGGTAELLVNTDASSALTLGSVGLDARAAGGGARGSENTTGGDAFGGNVNVTIDGGAVVQIDDFGAITRADSGGATSTSGLTALSGNARGGNVTIVSQGASALTISGGATLDSGAISSSSENVGTGTGGTVSVSAIAAGVITFGDGVNVNAFGGSLSSGLPRVAGSGTGGTVTFLADTSGQISAANYNVDARGNVVNAVTSTGIAQGGEISLTSLNGGLIQSTNSIIGIDSFNTSAQTGFSQDGASATGGNITIFANEGSISLANLSLSASGVSGGALGANGAIPVGTGGTILIRTGFDASSSLIFGSLSANTDGATQAFTEGTGGAVFEPAGDGQGGTINVEANGGDFTAFGPINLSANGNGGIGRGTTGRGGNVTFTQIGGNVVVGDFSINADGYGGFATGRSGDGFGGAAVMNLLGGTFTGSDVSVSASGFGGAGFSGDDFDSANVTSGGNGGNGQGGDATITIDGDAVVSTTVLAAYASGNGGAGGDFISFAGTEGTAGSAGDGRGGFATINLNSGTLDSDAVEVDAGGFGGSGGSVQLFCSSSCGNTFGYGVAGDGGNGDGGFATINLRQTVVNISESLTSRSLGMGGDGGTASNGGAGGYGAGGVAQAIVEGFDAGELSVTLDASATGGNGGDGLNGEGGQGGSAFGGTTRVEAIGEDARVIVSQGNFVTTATGGNGGDAFTDFFATPAVAGSGGHGGNAQGGTIEVVARDGAIVGIGAGRTGGGGFSSSSVGGDGGRGADNPRTITLPGPDGIPGTMDDVVQGLRGGDGGIGGEGAGGTVSLLAFGGTITSGGAPITISVGGVSGNGGDGGVGSGGNGFCCSGFINLGGRVFFQAASSETGGGVIDLGDTVIDASGGLAGRIEMRTDTGSSINMTSLLATAFGFAGPTNNDIDMQSAGIFFAADGGTISTANDMVLRSGSSFGAYVSGSGSVNSGGALTIEADDQVDIRHDDRGDAANATLFAEGELSITAFNSLRATPGAVIDSNSILRLTTNGPNGSIDVDRIDGDNIFITSAGRASIEHAEAENNFTANVGSFRTGLNSIITGGNISITSPGAVDLGNSTAGGSVFVTGQSIVFNNIDAGFFVGLNATGTATGAEGIRGGSITSDNSSVNLNANSITVDSIQSDSFLSAIASGGNIAIGEAIARSGISVFAQGDVTGSYASSGDIFLSAVGDIVASASAIGEGGSSSSGSPTAASVYADAGGDIILTNSEASGMFGVAAGGAVDIDGATVGEDMLVVAGTTATLANITVGDDFDAFATGDISATNVSTTGAGPDTQFLLYLPEGGFTITQGEGSSAVNGADINMISTAGTIAATDVSAADDMTLDAAVDITGDGDLFAGGNMTLTADGAIAILNAETGDGGAMTLTGATGVTASQLFSRGVTTLTADDGDIQIGSMNSFEAVTASANSLNIGTNGPIEFASIVTDVGDATISSNNLLIIDSATVAGTARFSNSGEHMIIRSLTAADAQFDGNDMITLTSVNVTNSIDAFARGLVLVDGVVTARNIAIASGDITIASSGRVGTAGTTQGVSIQNSDNEQQTFVGGTGTRNGYHIDADELTRLFGTDIEIFAPEVDLVSGGSVGSSAPPDVIVDSFTMTGGGPNAQGVPSNLGANGSLTIRTPGKMRVIGNVQLTGLSDGNSLNLFGDDSVEVILGSGSVNLRGQSPDQLAGNLTITGEDIVIATMQAITDISSMTSTSAIDARLAQNDGIISDIGALSANRITLNHSLDDSVYIQNSGAGTAFDDRRGITFGSGGLYINGPGNQDSLVINAVHRNANGGLVTGLSVIPLVNINAPSGSTTVVQTGFNGQSTINGCVIANVTSCSVRFDSESLFPVQDVIEDEDGEGDEGDGTTLPTALITMRDLDPLTGEPLLDDPVTGAGNDDLWTPTTDTPTENP